MAALPLSFSLVAAVPAAAQTTGRLTGHVLHSLTLEPIAGAVLKVVELKREVESGPDGAYAFDGLASGVYMLLVFDSVGSYGQETRRDLVVDGAARPVPVDVHLYPGGGIRVLVRGADGAPVPRARVVTRFQDGLVYQFGEYQSTGDDGRFAARGLKQGRWTVAVEVAGVGAAETTVDVPASDESVAVELRLE
jgi:hypothetical protein